MSSETALTKQPKTSSELLQECLTSIHESSRIATEISALDSKLSSLTSIKQTLITGDNISTANLDQLNKTIGEVQANVDSKRKELAESEQLVISGFLEVMSQSSRQSENKTQLVMESVKDSLFKFSSTVRGEVDEKLTEIKKMVTQLEGSKMNVADKDGLVRQIESIESTLTTKQQEDMSTLFAKNIDFMKKMTAKIGTSLEDIDTSRLTTNITESIMNNVDTKLKEQLESIQKRNNETKTTITELPRVIENYVKKELGEQITPANIQKIIQSLPEYEMMKRAGQQIATSTTVDTQNLPNFEAIKQSILTLTSQLTELKQSNDATKALLDTMRTHNLPSSAMTAPNVFEHEASVKHIEEMEREIKVIHNNIKMIETVVNMKSKEMESQHDVVVGAKRPRNEASSTSTAIAVPNNSEYINRFIDIETKHQKLIDFIVQCKETVLNDEYPTRLKAALTKIQQVLLNHEHFISYLINPFETTKNLRKAAISNEAVPEGTLDPAMTLAISDLVKKTAEEISLPLQKKIKLLEEKLEARSNASS